MLTIFVSLIVSRAVRLFFVRSVVVFGLMALFIVFCLCGLVGFSLCRWLGMVVLLVYVGGLMVMFSYFLAICPNEVIRFKGLKGVFGGCVVARGVGLMVSGPVVPHWLQGGMSMCAIYRAEVIPVLVFIILILLLTLIAVVKVVELKQGPLRPFSEKKARVKREFRSF